jgi:predicted O-linked N-acetylglucosamine transferase (SPINDLY family)
MDFRITDAWADPPGETERWHTETLVRLPASLWCYSAWPDSPPVSDTPCLRRGYITFGSTNNPAKLNPAVIETWATILGRTPDSRLLMYAPDDGDLRSRLVGILRHLDIRDDRVAFFPRLPINEYLARYSEIDIALDTFPCAGGTTTLDALWMGVPVISLAGERPFSRGGASILGNAGLPECLAKSREDYVERAIALSVDIAALATRRSASRKKLESGPMMDAGAFARAMEEAFIRMCIARGLALPGAD